MKKYKFKSIAENVGAMALGALIVSLLLSLILVGLIIERAL